MRAYSGIFKALGIMAFVVTFFGGTASAAPAAVPAGTFGHFLAGYYANQSNRGAKANISWADPYLINDPSMFSTEWVMSTDGSGLRWVQIGWMKFGDGTGAQYFGEYGCPGDVCRYTNQSYAPPGTTHEYRAGLNNTNDTWIGRIDGNVYAQAPVSLVGFTQTSQLQFMGETTYAGINLGGTPANPVALSNVSYSSAPAVWKVVGLAKLTQGIDYQCYFATKGSTGGQSNVANWTDRSGYCP